MLGFRRQDTFKGFFIGLESVYGVCYPTLVKTAHQVNTDKHLTMINNVVMYIYSSWIWFFFA